MPQDLYVFAIEHLPTDCPLGAYQTTPDAAYTMATGLEKLRLRGVFSKSDHRGRFVERTRTPHLRGREVAAVLANHRVKVVGPLRAGLAADLATYLDQPALLEAQSERVAFLRLTDDLFADLPIRAHHETDHANWPTFSLRTLPSVLRQNAPGS